MGKTFGNLHFIRGIIYYTISPYEQRAFAGFIKEGIPNLLRRFTSQIFVVGPPFALAYLVYDYGEKLHAQSARKNPDDYKDDK
ncbi:cytochrome b-c1 complex subunit 8 [Centruroides vittatus]|uniref:cytochrome b-c1 complex subunit 8 n=1 Tax=Centruroides vittatus TaxID=120091 RepID=UPI00351056FB